MAKIQKNKLGLLHLIAVAKLN